MSSPAISERKLPRENASELVVRAAADNELAAWDSIVTRFPNCRVFHRLAWCRSVSSGRLRAVYLIVESDGEIVAALPGFLRRLGPLRLFASPVEGTQTESMGPVFDPERVRGADVVRACVAYLERQFRVHHIEIVSRDLEASEMTAMGFRPHSQFTYRAALHPDQADLGFAALNSKTRNLVRKGMKSGVTVTHESGEGFIREMYTQSAAVFRRRGNAMPFGEERFRRCAEALRECGCLVALAARSPEGTCIATGLFAADGRELILWMWTHVFEHRKLSPTVIMTWTAMEYAAAQGCTVFDMTGGGEAKRKFGGTADEKTLRWIRSRYAWLGTARLAAFKIYRWQQRLRGRISRLSARSTAPAAAEE
jgi:CelD/BcsL family acetyltransferase involved in cellulose biosynthesis